MTVTTKNFQDNANRKLTEQQLIDLVTQTPLNSMALIKELKLSESAVNCYTRRLFKQGKISRITRTCPGGWLYGPPKTNP